jgi:hypothetical protein
MESMLLFRQGDILIQKIVDRKQINPDKKYEVCKDKIIARGEATGHHHSFSENAQILLLKNEGSLEPEILEVSDDNGAILTHQEHLPISIPSGI